MDAFLAAASRGADERPVQHLLDVLSERADLPCLLVEVDAGSRRGSVAAWAPVADAGDPLAARIDQVALDASQLRALGLVADDGRALQVRTTVPTSDLPPALGSSFEGVAAVHVVSLPSPDVTAPPRECPPHRAVLAPAVDGVDLDEVHRVAATAALLEHRSDQGNALLGDLLLAEAANQQLLVQLEDSRRLVDRVGAQLGHEVRDAVRAVMGWSRLAATSDIDGRVRRDMIERIRRSTERATAAVGDALEDIEASQGERNDASLVDLQHTVGWVTDTLASPILGARALVQADDDLPVLVGSATTLRLVLLELVRNAVEHGGRGVHVHVSAGLADGTAEIRVQDDGPGLDETALLHAFDAGYSTGTGSGYGLTRVRDALERLGGRIWLEEQPRGALFVVAIPQAGSVRMVRDAVNDRS